MAREYLRRHILECADVRVRVELLGHSGDPEVGDLNVSGLFTLEQDVLRLQITVDDVLRVAILNSRCYLPQEE